MVGRLAAGLIGDRFGLLRIYVATTLLLAVVSWTTWLVSLP